MRNLKVSAQLIIGFVIMLLFICVLGVVSYQQAEKIHERTETIYDHPLQVRAAIGRLQSDILEMRLETRNLLLAKNKDEQQSALTNTSLAQDDAVKQFGILEDRILGPKTDVEN